eukprot:TRINITY_DN11655_c0_g1_i2.p2 TRINITY_DN11655_c0_g1~~TRINITY_DN11655_c0_g1_i2.p2  ORF type:complete len:166 (+),score=9.94 TRINITY_DN11655_c0_g1_i2:165-662(+)
MVAPAWSWATPLAKRRDFQAALPELHEAASSTPTPAPATPRPWARRRIDASAGCLEEQGVDLLGGDLRSGAEAYDVASPVTCCALCAAVTSCWGWAFRSQVETCYLKGGVARRQRAANVTAGYVRRRNWLVSVEPGARSQKAASATVRGPARHRHAASLPELRGS